MTLFKVSGMSCGGCAKAVTRAIQGVSPTAVVAVDLKQGTVDVRGDFEPSHIAAAITAAGFGVDAQAHS